MCNFDCASLLKLLCSWFGKCWRTCARIEKHPPTDCRGMFFV